MPKVKKREIGYGVAHLDPLLSIVGPIRRQVVLDQGHLESTASDLGQALYDLVKQRGHEVAGLSGAQLQGLERVLCAALAAVREEQVHRWFTVREWRKNGPGIDLYGIRREQAWIDHPTQLVKIMHLCRKWLTE
jgi:hypothetical protein